MELVLFCTATISLLALAVLRLAYYSNLETIKTMAKAVAISFVTFYVAIWLASYDEKHLKVSDLHSFRYPVYQTRESLMLANFGIPGHTGEESEPGCFFYSINGKVISTPLAQFGLTDDEVIGPMTKYVVEDYYLVRSDPVYFDVKLKKHKEWLETFDYRSGAVRRIRPREVEAR